MMEDGPGSGTLPPESQQDEGQCSGTSGTVQSLQGLVALPATLWKPFVPDSPQADVTYTK